MIFLFIGGNSDGDEIEVDDGKVVWRVADKPVRSLALGGENKPRGSCRYTKRIIRRWSLSGGFWATDYYFAAENLTDEDATNRFLELQR